jgi:L-ascorbate metabolism protein UlaG (beta-lactamase superfamily)
VIVSPRPTTPSPDPPERSVRIRWLGQAGFLIEGAKTQVLIDPWFSQHELRLAPAPLMDDIIGPIDELLVTHEHADHMDLDAIAELHRRFPRMRISVPTPLMGRVRDRASDANVEGVQPGDHLESPGLVIDVVPAWHGVVVEDGYSAGPEGRPTPHVGYVIGLGGLRIYHAGDTIASTPLVESVRRARVQVALLPINGRDFYRESAGILGNLDATEAAHLAADVGAGILVPMHYEMVDGNTASPGAVVDAVARLGLPIHVLVPTPLHPFWITL